MFEAASVCYMSLLKGRLGSCGSDLPTCFVQGIGEWTTHMFMMFTLHRPDVLPTGDLGVKKVRALG
jgi:hypothetical protein